MPFWVQAACPCCVAHLHHCEKCWNKFHNGEKHKDFIAPEYYGQSMWTEEHIKDFEDFMEDYITKHPDVLIKNPHITRPFFKRPIMPNKQKIYKEGDYNH